MSSKTGHLQSDPWLGLNRNAPRKATNLSVNTEVLALARAAGINLSQELENALLTRLREQRQQRWLEENQEAIANYNDRVAATGAFADELRLF